jgi:hypothetical protein
MECGSAKGCGGRVTLRGNGVRSTCPAADLYPFREGQPAETTAGQVDVEHTPGNPAGRGVTPGVRRQGPGGKALLAGWIAWARRSRLAEFVKLARTIQRFQQLIWNTLRHNICPTR